MLLFAFAIALSAVPQDSSDLQVCLEDPPGLVGTTVCYGDHLERAKAAQEALLARIHRKLDLLPADGGVNPAEARRALGEAQRSWTAFVDADCTAGEALFGEGNAFNLARLGCEIDHVEARTAQLLVFEDSYLWSPPSE